MDPEHMPALNGTPEADTAAGAGESQPATSPVTYVQLSGSLPAHDSAQHNQPVAQAATAFAHAKSSQHAATQQPTNISAVLRALHERSSEEEEHERRHHAPYETPHAAKAAREAGQNNSCGILRDNSTAESADAAGEAGALGGAASPEGGLSALNTQEENRDMGMPAQGGQRQPRAWPMHGSSARKERPVLQLHKGGFVQVGGQGARSCPVSTTSDDHPSASQTWQDPRAVYLDSKHRLAAAASPHSHQPDAAYPGSEHPASAHIMDEAMQQDQDTAAAASAAQQEEGNGYQQQHDQQQHGLTQQTEERMEIDAHEFAQPVGTYADDQQEGRDFEHPGLSDHLASPEIPMSTAQVKENGATTTSGRRHPEIKPETDAGMVVWAKTPRYPWWPAQVLAPGDSWIPADMDMPRRGAVPVRFFGTYKFCWIESQRALAPFTGADDEERTGKSKLKVFQEALQEAAYFAATGEEPAGFQAQQQQPPDGAQAADSSKPGRPRRKEAKGDAKKEGRKTDVKRRDAGKAAAAERASAQRKLKAMRAVGLTPPRDSPYADRVCLDVARKWLPQAVAQQRAYQLQMQEHHQRQQQALLQQQLLQRRLQEQALMQQRQGGLHPQIVIYRPQADPTQAAASQPSPQHLPHSLPQ